jgi:hypothetical protein
MITPLGAGQNDECQLRNNVACTSSGYYLPYCVCVLLA